MQNCPWDKLIHPTRRVGDSEYLNLARSDLSGDSVLRRWEWAVIGIGETARRNDGSVKVKKHFATGNRIGSRCPVDKKKPARWISSKSWVLVKICMICKDEKEFSIVIKGAEVVFLSIDGDMDVPRNSQFASQPAIAKVLKRDRASFRGAFEDSSDNPCWIKGESAYALESLDRI